VSPELATLTGIESEELTGWESTATEVDNSAPAASDSAPHSATANRKSHTRKKKADAWARGIDWPTTIWITLLHVGALAAPFFFTWKAVGIFFLLHWFTGGVGVCLGFHRCLTHGSFTTYRPVRWALAFIGSLAGEGSAITWVATHRKHHVYSDQPDDPHSPHDGGLWSHMLWFIPKRAPGEMARLYDHYAPDLARDPGIRFIDKTFLLWSFLMGAALLGLGWGVWDMHTGLSFLVWGLFLRMIFVHHVTWLVNSASHMWGYRNYETTDDSRNLWWVGLVAYGEGWHNNHHAFQRMAKHGHKWWEFDATYWTICAMEKIGIAWNVVHDVPARKRQMEKAAVTGN